jgi:hypothetical protein
MMMIALAGWTICVRLRTVLWHDKYKRSKGKQMLSDYCHFSLEAYIVLTYYNGYECWKSEVDLERGSVSGSNVSELSSVSSRLFTERCGPERLVSRWDLPLQGGRVSVEKAELVWTDWM